MDPILERELETAARLKGQTKSQFIIDAVERALGHRNPYELLLQVQEEVAEYRVTPDDSPAPAPAGSVKSRVRSALQAEHGKRQKAWVEDQPVAGGKRGARGRK